MVAGLRHPWWHPDDDAIEDVHTTALILSSRSEYITRSPRRQWCAPCVFVPNETESKTKSCMTSILLNSTYLLLVHDGTEGQKSPPHFI